MSTIRIIIVSQVALKELRNCSYNSEDWAEVLAHRLPQYVADAQSLDHPNVCRVIGLRHRPGLAPLLVLPYFPHRDIISFLKSHPDKDDNDRIKLVNVFPEPCYETFPFLISRHLHRQFIS